MLGKILCTFRFLVLIWHVVLYTIVIGGMDEALRDVYGWLLNLAFLLLTSALACWIAVIQLLFDRIKSFDMNLKLVLYLEHCAKRLFYPSKGRGRSFPK